MKRLALFLLALSMGTSYAQAGSVVVDAGGGGDYTEIQPAIDAAADGDVLIVKPGLYPPFVVDKNVSVLGEPGGERPRASAQVVSATGAVLGGFRLFNFEIVDTGGIVLVEDCEIYDPDYTGVLIERAALVHFSRCVIGGTDGDPFGEGPGMRIEDSEVTLTGCTVSGGDGWSSPIECYAGRPGIILLERSTVLLARTTVIGGSGGCCSLFGSGGEGASAVTFGDFYYWSVDPGSVCVVRGNRQDSLEGGFHCTPVGGQAASVGGFEKGEIVISGVQAELPTFLPDLTITEPVPAEPFLHIVGNDLPGSFKRLNMYGPAGSSLLLVVSIGQADLGQPAIVDGPLFVDPSSIILAIPHVLNGQATPESEVLRLPPVLTGLEGQIAMFQGFAAGLGSNGKWLATNPAVILIR